MCVVGVGLETGGPVRLARQQPLRCSERPRKNDIENERAAQRIPSRPARLCTHVCAHTLFNKVKHC